MPNSEWEVAYYETSDGKIPVEDFLASLPAKHRAKVQGVIERLRVFGPLLPFPHSSNVQGTAFRELRTSFAGQQYRVLYVREGELFVLFAGFHKKSDRDLGLAVPNAQRHLEQYRREQ